MSLSIPEIAEAVAADLAERGHTAEVIFGGWKRDYLTGGNRVVFSLDVFESDQPGPPNAPGVQYTDDPDFTKGARSLFTRIQNCTVYVHGAAPGARDPDRSKKAHEATAALLHAVIAALYHVAHGSFGWGGGKWPSDPGQDFVYGSLATFTAQISIPVLDDELRAVTLDAEGSTTQTSSVDANGEEELVAESPAPDP